MNEEELFPSVWFLAASPPVLRGVGPVLTFESRSSCWQFDDSAEALSPHEVAREREQLEAIATDAAREIALLLERLALRVESALERR